LPRRGRRSITAFQAVSKGEGSAILASVAIAVLTFALLFCGAMLGMVFGRALPEHHLSTDSKDVMKLGMGLVATISALVLGLLIATAKSAYDEQRKEIDQISANIILLDGALADYGPQAGEARDALRATATMALRHIWPSSLVRTARADDPKITGEGRLLGARIRALEPRNDMERKLQATALQIHADLARAYLLLTAQREDGAIPAPFLVILISWLVVLFALFGLFASPNATVITTLTVCALSVSCAIFLILDFAHPFAGVMQISSAPLQSAVSHLAP
jgi:uncharacterized membrane protein